MTKEGPATPVAELAHLAGVGTSVEDHGIGRASSRRKPWSVPCGARFPQPDGTREGLVLSPDQKAAADGLAGQGEGVRLSATLLDGVPGAGKTEVYFEAIAARQVRRQVLGAAEIALTAQWLKRFEDRFGAPPAARHSGLTSLERRETWRAIAEGRVSVGYARPRCFCLSPSSV